MDIASHLSSRAAPPYSCKDIGPVLQQRCHPLIVDQGPSVLASAALNKLNRLALWPFCCIYPYSQVQFFSVGEGKLFVDDLVTTTFVILCHVLLNHTLELFVSPARTVSKSILGQDVRTVVSTICE